ncbi:hypothetical protein EPO33_02800 [Patescibacteria group bacterium]|nr:MAG: hypothetical protein EPO33_02800 [Patescibacteria group bacterium]
MMSAVGVAAPLMAMAALSGCGLILDLDPWPPAPPDASAGVDGGDIDAAVDGGPDGMRDAFLPDAPADATADAALDAGMFDAASDADAGSDDAGTDADAGPPEGCADDSIEQHYPVDPGTGLLVMVGCDGARTQCEAEELCAPGWRLCTFAAYRTRGGTTMPATARRWLAGCVREMCGDVTGPGTAVCASCATGTGTTLELSYQCGSGEPARSEDDCNVGIAAAPDDWHLVSRSLECIMASAEPASDLGGATCCR